MPSPLELDFHDRLGRYLDGRRSLNRFKEWPIGATWDVDAGDDPAAIALTYEIKPALAEHSSGNVAEAELRRELASLGTTNLPSPTALTAG